MNCAKQVALRAETASEADTREAAEAKAITRQTSTTRVIVLMTRDYRTPSSRMFPLGAHNSATGSVGNTVATTR